MKRLVRRVIYVFVLMICFMVAPSGAPAATSPDGFYNKYIGKSLDVDNYPGSQPYQCYDLWARFVMDEYGTSLPIIISPTGLAKDIWNNFEGLGLSAYFTKVSGTPQDGDWVIYDSPAFSHVGMFRADNGDGTITILHQNYLGQAFVTQDRFTKNHILGYIRPNIYMDVALDRQRNVTISIDKNEIQTGEDVTFSFSAPDAEGFTVEIYKDGTEMERKDCGSITSYSRSFSSSGNYSAYVTAYDGKKSLGIGRVTFIVKAEDTDTAPVIAGETPVLGSRGTGGAKPITVTVNGTPVLFDQVPVILNGRTLVPMRAIFEALGTQVDWEKGKQMVTATKGKTTIILEIGSNQAIVNGAQKSLEVPAQIINNRTLIPVRFISESLGAEVAWVIRSQTVTINQ